MLLDRSQLKLWRGETVPAVSPSAWHMYNRLEENAVDWLISQNDLSGYQITKSISFRLNLFNHASNTLELFLSLYLSWKRNQK
jgi:hypothetical protein